MGAVYTSSEIEDRFTSLSSCYSRYNRITSSRQRELDAQTEILSGRRITAARKQWGVGLTIIIETHGQEFAKRIIGRETQLQGIITTAGTARHGGNITNDSSLLAETEVVDVPTGKFKSLMTPMTNDTNATPSFVHF